MKVVEEKKKKMTPNVNCEKIILAEVMRTDGKGSENRCVDQLRGGRIQGKGGGCTDG